jgi:hypothetical protein
MKLYTVETAFGRYPDCHYDLAMKTCANAIASGNSPYAFMYDSKTQALVNEFFHASINIVRK